ncbi:MAG: hypothetical protein ICV78_00940 [Tolypothrix sp. Co-bin9]|nr:hypothetical protein [Tolypothrix sp. Co-bin9]
MKPQRYAKLSPPSKHRKIRWIYKLFKGAIILPTAQQALKCVYLCQALTTVYKPIYMVRLDERTGKLFILAGDDIQILISRDGNWDYL